MTRVPRRAGTAGACVMAALVLAGSVPAVRAQPDPERARTAKALFFDRKYAEARQAWEAVRAASTGAEAEAAGYWVARCSENLGENERALKEYDAFLAASPRDRALAEEARTGRVGLAAKLYAAGNKAHVQVLRQALSDPSKTVRYYAALQMADLGPDMARLAVPVLRQIIDAEKDPDLVDRTKIKLLRLDPSALEAPKAAPAPPRAAAPPAAPGHEARWVHVRVTEKGGARPKVSINVPLALAEMVFKSLPDELKDDLRHKGYDAESFWAQLRKMGPSQIISIEGDEGERIEIWTEE
jgi:tetratricopeptide (TPR) repeat protein